MKGDADEQLDDSKQTWTRFIGRYAHSFEGTESVRNLVAWIEGIQRLRFHSCDGA